MTIKYIHIGYPKNLSTSLQRDFFGRHQELMHLGVGCNNNNLGYIDDFTSLAVEFYLRYAKDFVYQSKAAEIKDHFAEYFEAAQKNPGIKAVGLSGEHMGFNFTPDNIDISQKAARLHDIFGSDTKIIMIIRNQLPLIKSLYNECVRVGYPKSFRDYINYITMFYERTFVSDFFYGHAYAMYADLFGAQNILVIPIETVLQRNELIRNDAGQMVVLKKISDWLHVSYPQQDLGHYNQALDQAVIVKTMELNAKNPHDLGNSIFGTAESHRIRARYEEWGVPPPDEVENDVFTKRRVICEAIEKAKQTPHLKVDYGCDSVVWGKLEDLFRPTNNFLAEKTGLDLAQMGYAV